MDDEWAIEWLPTCTMCIHISSFFFHVFPLFTSHDPLELEDPTWAKDVEIGRGPQPFQEHWSLEMPMQRSWEYETSQIFSSKSHHENIWKSKSKRSPAALKTTSRFWTHRCAAPGWLDPPMTTFEKFGDPALGCEPYWYQGREWEIVLLKQLQKLSEYTFLCYMFGSCKRIAPAFFAIFEDDINLLRRIPT